MTHNGTTSVSVIDALRLCTTQERIEKVFADHHISDARDKRQCLLQSMGVIDEANAPTPDILTDEEAYQYEIELFLEGSWRLLFAQNG